MEAVLNTMPSEIYKHMTVNLWCSYLWCLVLMTG